MLDKIKIYTLIFLQICLASIGIAAAYTAYASILINTNNSGIIAIVTPMKTESMYIRSHLLNKSDLMVNGVDYCTGTIAGKKIVTIVTGMGKTNAAAVTARLIDDLHPKLVILSGISGGVDPELKDGSVIIGRKIIDIDYDKYKNKKWGFYFPEIETNPQNNKPFPVVYSLDRSITRSIEKLIANHRLAANAPITLGNIGTSDIMKTPIRQVELMRNAKIISIDDESSAVAHVCWLYNVPCIIVRSISNQVEAGITDNEIQYAADNAGKVTVNLIKALH